MNKPELIHHMAVSMENTGYEDARLMVDIILASIADTLAAGARVDKKPSRSAISGASVFVITNRASAEIRKQVNWWISPGGMSPTSGRERNCAGASTRLEGEIEYLKSGGTGSVYCLLIPQIHGRSA
uniref:Uncharacterized protein n=1 Tax=Candidatus Kentrum sp. UNK TaxID=2126344 RepID=A0A451B3R7_9GAMM|nr:MAG: hypothetical protein BECKUNK1418G_GA0071005_11443 [Candidatus Kentron sp. UNK]VFK72897.1 MAG: hypothetical protein BECKUNK1418H_GA0071006_11479 [Candidatus Kentron sp. UNK]